MDTLLKIVLDFLEQDNWPVQPMADLGILQTQFQGDNGHWICQARANAEISQVVFYALCPVNAPPAKIAALAEYITRANYDLVIGNFELNFETGQVRFKTSLDVEGTQLTPELVKNLVYANVFLMDKYLPGILKVIYTDTPPALLISQLEAD